MSDELAEDLSAEDFRAIAKTAMTDDEAWDLLVATEPDRLAMWLTDTVIDIQNQLTGRRTDWEAYKSSGHHAYADFKQEEALYHQWKRSALRFKQSCEARKRQLKLDTHRNRVEAIEAAKQSKPAPPRQGLDALGRAREHAERTQVQLRQAVNSLADLASLVEAFTAGAVGAGELDAALDDLTIAHNDTETRTLRELLGAMRVTRIANGDDEPPALEAS